MSVPEETSVSETSIADDQLLVTREDIARRLSVGHTTIWESTSCAGRCQLRAVERLLLTPEQAARVLAIGRSKVYDLLRSEDLSSIRIGGSRRIPVSALHEFVGRLRSAQSA
jgi:excisionase family DNA binding protein